RRKEATAAEKARLKGNFSVEEDQRALRPDELDKPGRAAKGSGEKGIGATAEDSQRPMMPSDLGTKTKKLWGSVLSTFGASQPEEAPFTGEPPREAMTAPPTGYQTPSPNYPYGVGVEDKRKATTLEDRLVSGSKKRRPSPLDPSAASWPGRSASKTRVNALMPGHDGLDRSTSMRGGATRNFPRQDVPSTFAQRQWRFALAFPRRNVASWGRQSHESKIGPLHRRAGRCSARRSRASRHRPPGHPFYAVERSRGRSDSRSSRADRHAYGLVQGRLGRRDAGHVGACPLPRTSHVQGHGQKSLGTLLAGRGHHRRAGERVHRRRLYGLFPARAARRAQAHDGVRGRPHDRIGAHRRRGAARAQCRAGRIQHARRQQSRHAARRADGRCA